MTLDWPIYADGIGMPAIRELYEAAEDYTSNHGAHSGPCDNEGIEQDESCQSHVKAARQREVRLKAALRQMEQELA